MQLGYEILPSLPSNDECKRILDEYKSFPFSIVPKENMTLLSNGLLPGHIIMLWWLDNARTSKNDIPRYFLYEYGIIFGTELKKLIQKKLVFENIITEAGKKEIELNRIVIRNHKALKLLIMRVKYNIHTKIKNSLYKV